MVDSLAQSPARWSLSLVEHKKQNYAAVKPNRAKYQPDDWMKRNNEWTTKHKKIQWMKDKNLQISMNEIKQ